MEITIINENQDQQLIEYEEDLLGIAEKLSQLLNLTETLECAVILVCDTEIRQINKEYRQKDSVTDVISFAMKDQADEYEINDEIANCLGDIFISVPAVFRQAKSYGHSVKREFLFLFVHGLLHLLGYNHEDEESEKVMFSLQEEILNEIH